MIEIKKKLKKIKVISFDLDDTLWLIEPIIKNANEKIIKHIIEKYPRINLQEFLTDKFINTYQNIKKTNPKFALNLTELKRLTYESLLLKYNYNPKDSYVLIKEFYKLRHDIIFFSDVIPILKLISKKYKIISITNGNADINRLKIREYFLDQFRAGDIGYKKPNPNIFLYACKSIKIPPTAIMHIGDNPIDDVMGAKSVGMKSVWLNRFNKEWENEEKPDIMIRSLYDLKSLLL